MWVAGLFVVGVACCSIAAALLGREVASMVTVIHDQRHQIDTLAATMIDRGQNEAAQARTIIDLKDHLRLAADALVRVSTPAPAPAIVPVPVIAPAQPLPSDPYARMETLLQHAPKPGCDNSVSPR